MAEKSGKRGRVIAFEPNPYTFNLLRKNISLNLLGSRVKAYNIAVSDNDKPVTLFQDGPESRIISVSGQDMRNISIIPANSLDRLLEGRKVDIIKIDTEGHEIEVMRGSVNLLRRKRGYPRFIFMELHPYRWDRQAQNSEAIMKSLRDSGYAVEITNTEWPPGTRIEDSEGVVGLFAAREN